MTKAGTSKRAAADRRALFVRAYLGNGHNATQAAIETMQGGPSRQESFEAGWNDDEPKPRRGGY